MDFKTLIVYNATKVSTILFFIKSTVRYKKEKNVTVKKKIFINNNEKVSRVLKVPGVLLFSKKLKNNKHWKDWEAE